MAPREVVRAVRVLSPPHQVQAAVRPGLSRQDWPLKAPQVPRQYRQQAPLPQWVRAMQAERTVSLPKMLQRGLQRKESETRGNWQFRSMLKPRRQGQYLRRVARALRKQTPKVCCHHPRLQGPGH